MNVRPKRGDTSRGGGRTAEWAGETRFGVPGVSKAVYFLNTSSICSLAGSAAQNASLA